MAAEPARRDRDLPNSAAQIAASARRANAGRCSEADKLALVVDDEWRMV